MNLRRIVVLLMIGLFGMLALGPGFNPLVSHMPRPKMRIPGQSVHPVYELLGADPEKFRQFAFKSLQVCLPRSGQAGLDNPQISGIVVGVIEEGWLTAYEDFDQNARQALVAGREDAASRLTHVQQMQLDDFYYRLETEKIWRCIEDHMTSQIFGAE